MFNEQVYCFTEDIITLLSNYKNGVDRLFYWKEGAEFTLYSQLMT
jgi:hypothetical protein